MLSLISSKSSDAQFLAVFNRLAVALREPQDDTGITQGVYFEALKDLPFTAVEAGAAALMKEPGRRFFPTTAEWHAAAQLAAEAELRDTLKHRVEPWKHECQRCEDTGWILGLTCDGGDGCGRQTKHYAHGFTRVCPCRATNRTYQRRQRFGAGE